LEAQKVLYINKDEGLYGYNKQAKQVFSSLNGVILLTTIPEL
jgi:hypothetical protein